MPCPDTSLTIQLSSSSKPFHRPWRSQSKKGPLPPSRKTRNELPSFTKSLSPFLPGDRSPTPQWNLLKTTGTTIRILIYIPISKINCNKPRRRLPQQKDHLSIFHTLLNWRYKTSFHLIVLNVPICKNRKDTNFLEILLHR